MEKSEAISKENALANALTPQQIVEELDKYIIGQFEAKRSVAIALRNRARRQILAEDMQDEVSPKNIIMIGSTGVGKTEIARRLAHLVNAPFIKVEASKYTEIGYVGRDVESMIRDLTETAVSRVKSEQTDAVKKKAREATEKRLLDYIFPAPSSLQKRSPSQNDARNEPEEKDTDATTQLSFDLESNTETEGEKAREKQYEFYLKTRKGFRGWLRDGRLEDRTIEIDAKHQNMPLVKFLSPGGIAEVDIYFKDMFGNILPNQTKKRRVSISEARTLLTQEEAEKLIDMDVVISEAIRRVENSGIVFLDEIDKVVSRGSPQGSDVSREGVQRDILPIIEGSTVATKYGAVRTHHILFIAAGAFHTSSPSDLIPELQGRFPIRVELKNLNKNDFKSILIEPKNALVKQYAALLRTEGIEATITEDAIDEIAAFAFQVNESVEDIGARRLHAIMEKLFENLFFNAPDTGKDNIVIDAVYVRSELSEIIRDQDLSRYIL